ncbi:MAG: hypothetical protein AAGC88_13035 [Bacteroidota bacterium]
MKTSLIFLFILVSVITAHSQTLPLSTNSDSAKYFYYQGWDEVMNNGNYAASEVAFRNMYACDSSFVLGQALLGRISDKAEEQKALIQSIESNLDSANSDEQLVLKLFVELIKRRVDQGSLTMDELSDLAINNLGTISRTYPNEDYYFAEYIEWINNKSGAQAALDSINSLATAAHHIMPFMIGFKVHLHLELKQFDHAQIYLNQLENLIGGKAVAKMSTLQAEYYIARGNDAKALKLIQDTERLDPKNLETPRLRQKISKTSSNR